MKINSIFTKTPHLSFLDIYSLPGNVKIQGKNSYSHILSITFSILSIITISVIGFYLTINTFKRRSISVIFNMDSMVNPVMNLTEFPFTLQLYDSMGDPLKEQDKIFYITALYLEIKPVLDKNNQSVPIREIHNIILEKCDFSKNFGKYQKFFENNNDMNNKYCFPANYKNITLYGKYGDTVRGFSNLYFFIQKCINGVNGKKNCYELEKIDDTLKTVNLMFSHLDYDIDHNNPNDPRVIMLKNDIYSLSSTVYTKIFKNINNVQYTSDYGYLFEKKELINFFQDDNERTENDFRKEGGLRGSFSSILLKSSPKTHKYTRVFWKLQDLLANIGGIINGITVVGNIVNFIITRNLLNFILFKTMFEILDDPKKKDLKSRLKQILRHKDNHVSNMNKNDSLKLIISSKDNVNVMKRLDPISDIIKYLLFNRFRHNSAKISKNIPKLRKMQYSITDIVVPHTMKKKNENLKIFKNFEDWVNSSLSLEKILEAMLNIKIFKKEWLENDTNKIIHNGERNLIIGSNSLKRHIRHKEDFEN